jgi:hypothetical protein
MTEQATAQRRLLPTRRRTTAAIAAAFVVGKPPFSISSEIGTGIRTMSLLVWVGSRSTHICISFETPDGTFALACVREEFGSRSCSVGRTSGGHATSSVGRNSV